MRIGVDIDGVLTNDDDYILDHAIKFCYEHNLNSYVDPYLYETRKFDWDFDILEAYREEYFWNYVIHEPPRKFASEVLQKLVQEGHEIYIITSRHLTTRDSAEGQKMRNMIIDWLRNYHIPYNELFFSKDKTVEIDKLKLDIIIEDSPETIPSFVKYTHVFCYDCRYNCDLNISNMTRVFSWYDIYRKIKNMEFTKEI